MGEVLMQPMGGGVGSDDVTATKAQVLTGYNTVTTDSDDEVVAGTMPNNGAMNVTLTPSGNGSTNQGVAAGYYSGGTITANGSSSYSQGVSDADGRVNTSSASYNSGYTNGRNVKLSTQTYQAKPRGQFVSHSLSVPAGKHIIIGVITTSSNGGFSGSLSGASFTNLTSNTMPTYANQLYINVGVVSLSSATTITLNGTLNSDYNSNQNMNFAIIAIQIG